MKRLDFLLVLALAVLAGFVGYEARGSRHVAAGAAGAVSEATLMDGAGAVVGAGEGRAAPPPRDPADVRRQLLMGAPGTYIGELLAAHDSALARWPDRSAKPLRVWIQPSSTIPDWRPELVQRARDAFATWQTVGIPVRFAFTGDSAAADVHVTWVDRFDQPISGKTLWARDEHWWIVDGDITLAIHHSQGEPLDASAVRAIALHEIGHLIGLDHTTDTANIMTPKVRVRELSPADRATARLLYALPPGAVR